MNRARRIDVYRCPNGHAFLHAAEQCTACGSALQRSARKPLATLTSCTTVRVNPGGVPFRLGIAECHGARTLCIVEGATRDNGHGRVVLTWHNGRVVARALAARVIARNPVRSSIPEDSKTR